MLHRSTSLILLVTFVATGCTAPRVTESELLAMENDAASAMVDFTSEDPGTRAWFDESYGYAIFPNIGKGGVGVGGAYGTGLVYEQGSVIGTSALSQVTIGFQLGGQTYKEVVFFEDEPALVRFTSGDFELAAQASVVLLTAGASADADFRDGMAIFTMPNGGLMYEASVGGQRFSFRAVD